MQKTSFWVWHESWRVIPGVKFRKGHAGKSKRPFQELSFYLQIVGICYDRRFFERLFWTSVVLKVLLREEKNEEVYAISCFRHYGFRGSHHYGNARTVNTN